MKSSPDILFTSYRTAARHAGTTPFTIARWSRTGVISPTAPWSARELDAAWVPAGGRPRGAHAVHGTASRWREGCACGPCLVAHNQDCRERRAAVRAQQREAAKAHLLEAVTEGQYLPTALANVGMTAQALTAVRAIDPAYAARLDAALMATRNPSLRHGSPGAWRGGCRCPECRKAHASRR